MKFVKLLFLLTFSLLSVGLNLLGARADEVGQGYVYGCQSPYSLPNGSVGCGDTSSTSSEDYCTYTGCVAIIF
jgi:hypothetical protein